MVSCGRNDSGICLQISCKTSTELMICDLTKRTNLLGKEGIGRNTQIPFVSELQKVHTLRITELKAQVTVQILLQVLISLPRNFDDFFSEISRLDIIACNVKEAPKQCFLQCSSSFKPSSTDSCHPEGSDLARFRDFTGALTSFKLMQEAFEGCESHAAAACS